MGPILCDRCGVRSAHLFTKSGAMELAFCGHHANKFRSVLLDQGFAEVSQMADISG